MLFTKRVGIPDFAGHSVQELQQFAPEQNYLADSTSSEIDTTCIPVLIYALELLATKCFDKEADGVKHVFERI